MRRFSSLAAILGLLLGMIAGARLASARDEMAGMTMSSSAISHHMALTDLRAPQPGDRARADAIVLGAKAAMKRWPDVASVEAAGYTKFAPGVSLPIEHYTSMTFARAALEGKIDPEHPSSMIFERHGSALTLVGVMYTAARTAPEPQLDAMAPLSIAQWHKHVNFCMPASGTRGDKRFGLGGSIDSQAECSAAGGRWMPQVFGWMVHVWPLEHDRKDIWAVDHHGDDHTMAM